MVLPAGRSAHDLPVAGAGREYSRARVPDPGLPRRAAARWSTCCSSSDNSLVRQSYSPRMMNTFLNLAGFGMKAWDPTSLRPEEPFSYRATTLPSFDRNLRFMSAKLAPTCLVAHVRGVTYSGDAVVADTKPAPLSLRRRPRRARPQRAPAAVPAHALRAHRPRAAGARAEHRGDHRLGVDLRARPLAARRSVRRAGEPRGLVAQSTADRGAPRRRADPSPGTGPTS